MIGDANLDLGLIRSDFAVQGSRLLVFFGKLFCERITLSLSLR